MIDKNLFKLLANSKPYIIYTVVFQILGMMANIGITACICWSVGLLVAQAKASCYLAPFVIAFFCILLRFVFSCMTSDLRELLGRYVKKDLRARIYDKILTMGIHSTEDLSIAGLTQVALEGVEQLDLYFSSYIPQFFFAMIAPFLLFLVCVWIDWRVALVLLCGVPLIPVSIVAVSRYAKKIFAKYWEKYISMGDTFLDSVQGLRELKIFRADGRQQIRMNENTEDFRKITMKVLVMQLASTTIMDLVAYGGAGIGIALALYGMHNYGLPPVSALFLGLVSVEFFLPLRAFGSAFHIAMNGASAGKKILTLLDTSEPIWGNTEVKDTAIRLDRVCFSYDGKREVLHDVSLTLPKKGCMALVGESGCGKSTIVSLIAGLHHPRKGEITIGNISLPDVARQSYYTHLAVISYNTHLFNCSIRDNFRLVKADVTDREIESALEDVDLADFMHQNGGLDRVLSEDAANISGGQKQRLAVAINLVADKDVYIFDEATSNIDVESEAIIMQKIYALSHKKSVIVISHRLENVISADTICYMEHGEIKERGRHEELMAKASGYAKLYRTQKALELGGTT